MKRLFFISILALLVAPSIAALKPEVLRSRGAVPAHPAGRFRDPAGFQQSASGQFFIFDRRGHSVYGLDGELASSWQIVHIGSEPGRIIDPAAFSVAPDGSFVVATRFEPCSSEGQVFLPRAACCSA